MTQTASEKKRINLIGMKVGDKPNPLSFAEEIFKEMGSLTGSDQNKRDDRTKGSSLLGAIFEKLQKMPDAGMSEEEIASSMPALYSKIVELFYLNFPETMRDKTEGDMVTMQLQQLCLSTQITELEKKIANVMIPDMALIEEREKLRKVRLTLGAKAFKQFQNTLKIST